MEKLSSLSNLQIELLKIFNYDLNDVQLREIKKILSDYFAQKLDKEIDEVFSGEKFDVKSIEKWSTEHMRLKKDI